MQLSAIANLACNKALKFGRKTSPDSWYEFDKFKYVIPDEKKSEGVPATMYRLEDVHTKQFQMATKGQSGYVMFIPDQFVKTQK